MSALESSIELFRNICQLTEQKIAAHFKRVDESTEKNPDNEALRMASLTGDISVQLNLKEPEVLYSIYLYLRNRPDLEVRSGKNGGICRIGDDRNKSPMTPQECGLKYYDVVKATSPAVIDKAFVEAENIARAEGLMVNKVRLNFQDLCAEIAGVLNVKTYSVYHCLKKYVQDERKDLIIALGRQGGLMKRE